MRTVIAVIKIADDFGPIDEDSLSDLALSLEIGSGPVKEAVVYRSLADLNADADEGLAWTGPTGRRS